MMNAETYEPYNPPKKPNQQPRPNQNPQNQGQAPRPKARNRPSIIYQIWRFSDPQMIDELSRKYLASMDVGTARAYLIGTIFLCLTTGILTWYLDVGPSYSFVNYAIRNSPQFMADFANFGSFLTVIALLFAVLPALLEFFSVGMALQGNIAMDWAIKIAIIFDAITDLPGAQTWARIIVSYFIPLDTPLGGLASFVGTLIVLFFATIAIETLFLSFSLALLRIIKQALIPQTYVRA